jgi:integrase
MARKRRGNNEGSVCQRADGKWMAVVSVRQAGGKRRRLTRFGKSKSHALVKLGELLDEQRGKTAFVAKDATVEEFLASWLATEIVGQREDSTIYVYRHIVETHIVPGIGRLKLVELRRPHIKSWIAAMVAGGVGGRTRQVSYSILRQAWDSATADELVEHNPFAKLRKPKHTRDEIRPFRASEARAILDAVDAHRLAAVYHLALSHGLRQGELFGLQWQDVDWKNSTIRVERQAAELSGVVRIKKLKTAAAARTVTLSASTLAALQSRWAFAMREQQHAPDAFVFPNRRGGVMQRSNFGSRHWTTLLRKLGLDHRGFHHCRHTAACLMLGEGVPVHIVAGVLGHSRPSTTLDTYSHLFPKDNGAAAQASEKAIGRDFG